MISCSRDIDRRWNIPHAGRLECVPDNPFEYFRLRGRQLEFRPGTAVEWRASRTEPPKQRAPMPVEYPRLHDFFFDERNFQFAIFTLRYFQQRGRLIQAIAHPGLTIA
jgi:hypothetical protein